MLCPKKFEFLPCYFPFLSFLSFPRNTLFNVSYFSLPLSLSSSHSVFLVFYPSLLLSAFHLSLKFFMSFSFLFVMLCAKKTFGKFKSLHSAHHHHRWPETLTKFGFQFPILLFDLIFRFRIHFTEDKYLKEDHQHKLCLSYW